MKVLIIGSGGREHAMAWKTAQSPLLTQLWIAPGNAGTSALGENVPIEGANSAELVRFAADQQIDLVLVGPEAPLAAGLVDEFSNAGIRAFGPTRSAAQIESSKVFSKTFMARHGIPTARFAVFRELDAALRGMQKVDYPVVIKASGLAAGKGVIVPDNEVEARAVVASMLAGGQFGEAGREVVIEERLEGPEVSLMAFTDGLTVRPMVPAQDHKRLLDGDQGPNTGGMGAYAPAPVCSPELVDWAVRAALQPTVDGLAREGTPFVGILYAGLMLTADGPKVLEFNCRFGDPEAQVVLPLLESDLLEIAMACTSQTLDRLDVCWKAGSAACVVLASQGYPARPASGRPIHGLDQAPENVVCFHAGTRFQEGGVVSAGGRVLGVASQAASLKEALDAVYAGIKAIRFDGMQYRRDIGRQALDPALQPYLPPQIETAASAPSPVAGESRAADGSHSEAPLPAGLPPIREGAEGLSAYTAAGVNIDAANRARTLMTQAVRSTYTPAVLAGIGAFGGLYDAAALKALADPVLVASTDGVGTKIKLATQAGRFRSLGYDIVNHCANDILVQGARPLFFLDYYASSHLEPAQAAEVVAGVSEACREMDCVLLGGETAEVPGIYLQSEFDLAGTIVGLVERRKILPRTDLQAGDVLLGLRSSGAHTNGYSLIRKIFSGVALDTVFPELGCTLGEALLAPHRSYFKLLWPALQADPSPVKALAHLTGGGFIENIPRILPAGLDALIHVGNWKTPPLFGLIQTRGGISTEEMYRVFNMGIGMVVITAADQAAALQELIPEECWVIGELTHGNRRTRLK